MAFLSFRASPSNNFCSLISVLTLILYLIPKLRIRNPKQGKKLLNNMFLGKALRLMNYIK